MLGKKKRCMRWKSPNIFQRDKNQQRKQGDGDNGITTGLRIPTFYTLWFSKPNSSHLIFEYKVSKGLFFYYFYSLLVYSMVDRKNKQREVPVLTNTPMATQDKKLNISKLLVLLVRISNRDPKLRQPRGIFFPICTHMIISKFWLKTGFDPQTIIYFIKAEALITIFYAPRSLHKLNTFFYDTLK